MFFKKKLLVQACASVLLTPISSYVIAEICIGNNYEYDVVAPDNAIPPTLKIELPEIMPSLSGGQSTNFKLTPTLATGETVADFFICAPEGELVAIAPDQIKYTAPSQVSSDKIIKIIAQVANSQGLVGGDNFYVQLKGSSTTAINGQLLDSNGKPISGVTITIGDKTVTTDSNGNYQISGLPLGTYTVTASNEGYSFSPTQVTLDATNTNPSVKLTGTFTDNVAQIVVGAHSCQDNVNRVLLINGSGETLQTFNSMIAGKGIDVASVDWDLNKTVDFLVASGLFSGNSAFTFDLLGKKLSALPVNTLNKGIRIVFGKFENGAVAVVVNQAKDEYLYIYPTGKEPYALEILKNATTVNVVMADLNGDGIDEMIVLSSREINGTNVLVLDSKAKALNSLLLTLDGSSATTNLPGLVGTAFVEQGKIILALGNAEGKNHKVALYSFDKDFKASFIKSFVPFTTATNNPCNIDVEGLLLSNTIQNNKSILLVSQNGSTELKSFDTDGSELKTIQVNVNNQAITGIAGTNQIINPTTGSNPSNSTPTTGSNPSNGTPTTGSNPSNGTPTTGSETIVSNGSTLPPPGIPIKDITIIGTSEKPLEVDNYDIEGKIHFENVVIVNIRIKSDARVTFGKNVRFKDRKYIPHHTDLSEIFVRIQQPLHKVKRNPSAIILTQNIVVNAPTILERIQGLIPAIQQDNSTGNLVLETITQRFMLRPVKIRQGDGKKPKGWNFEITGEVTFVTEEDHEVGLIPVMEDLESFGTVLEQNGVGGLEAADTGQITALPLSNPDIGFYAAMPEIFSESVDDAQPEGLQPVDEPNMPKENKHLVSFIFRDKHGKKRKQKLYPHIGELGLTSAQIDLNGIVSLTFKGVVYRGILDYGVLHGIKSTGLLDAQLREDGNAMIIYPSGKKQIFHLIK